MMGSVVVLLMFIVCFYTIMGIMLFTDDYHKACVHDTTGEVEAGFADPDLAGCGAWRSCPGNFTCKVAHGVDPQHCMVQQCTCYQLNAMPSTLPCISAVINSCQSAWTARCPGPTLTHAAAAC